MSKIREGEKKIIDRSFKGFPKNLSSFFSDLYLDKNIFKLNLWLTFADENFLFISLEYIYLIIR